MTFAATIRLLAVLVLLLAQGSAADAHSKARQDIAPGGVQIPNLTHGQMAVIARYATRILDLATTVPAPDPAFQRILNYARIQRTWCAWGLIPGSETDETSPFNECSHAWLAGAQDLLVRMGDTTSPGSGVEYLVREVEDAMIAGGASLVLCRFSDENFNTALIVSPDWNAVLFHIPSLVSVIAAGILVLLTLLAAFPLLRVPTESD